MLENFSRFWGGAAAIGFVADQDHLSGMTWEILRLYDADRFGYHVPTFRGLQVENPSAFEAWVEKESARLTANSQRSSDEAANDLRSEPILSSPRFAWRPSEALSNAVLRELGPYHFKDHVFQELVTDEWKPSYEFVDVGHLELEGGPGAEIVTAEDYGIELQLLAALRGGRLSAPHRELLKNLSSPVRAIPVGEHNLQEVLLWAWLPPEGRRRLSPFNSQHTALAKTTRGCNWFHTIRRWEERPYFLVVGAESDDFWLAQALDRLFAGTAWLPPKYLEDESPIRSAVIRALPRLLFELSPLHGRERSVFVLSVSLDDQQVRSVTEQLRGMTFDTATQERIRPLEGDRLPGLPEPQHLWDERAYMLSTYEPFVDGVQATRIETPIPSGVQLERTSLPRSDPLEYVSHLTWEVDVQVADFRLPTRSALASLLSDEAHKQLEIRVSSTGVSYFSQTAFVGVGQPLEKTLSRPSLKLPSAERVFQQLIARGSDAEFVVSPAGRYTEAILNLWGGLQALASVFLEDSSNGLLDAYVRQRGTNDQELGRSGIYLDSLSRRFLSFADMTIASGLADQELRKLIDTWSERRIFRRGLILKCIACGYDNWYSAEDIGQDFRCSRCGSVNPVSQRTWRKPTTEPNWYYQLAETAYQAIAKNVRVTVLALAALDREAETFHFVPEAELRGPAGSTLAEHDIWAFSDGSVVLGEANISGDFERAPAKRVQRLAQTARLISADRVVLATTANDWSPAIRNRIASAFASDRPHIDYVVGLGSHVAP